MRYLGLAAAMATAFAAPALAGDPVAGERGFNACVACHHVINADGDVLAGRPQVRTGPNLYGIMGRQAGTVEGFRYGRHLVEAGEAGLVWDEENLAAYIVNPTAFLQEFLDNRSARSTMTHRQPRGAEDISAWLMSISPVADEAEEEAEG